MSDVDWDAELIIACVNGDVAAFKKALANGGLYEGEESTMLSQACQKWHPHMIRFLLTSPELPSHASVHNGHDAPFRRACEEGDLELAKFLASSPELQEHADVHACCDEAFENACHAWHEDIIRYLVAEHGMMSSSYVAYFLTSHPELKARIEALGIKPGPAA